VQAASKDETLLNAILAVSAKHLNLCGKFDHLASDKYQRKCLLKLIPALNDHNSILDETLFAATIILRLLDEMTGM
jgi:Fungal specific transcription factor domain